MKVLKCLGHFINDNDKLMLTRVSQCLGGLRYHGNYGYLHAKKNRTLEFHHSYLLTNSKGMLEVLFYTSFPLAIENSGEKFSSWNVFKFCL